ncbi:hypothetical protein B0H11DRAFT_313420, partial [Mycena galericulata]
SAPLVPLTASSCNYLWAPYHNRPALYRRAPPRRASARVLCPTNTSIARPNTDTDVRAVHTCGTLLVDPGDVLRAGVGCCQRAQRRNIAYTNVELGLYMNLLYFVIPPKCQILHWLCNRVHSGASLFVNAFHTARAFHAQEHVLPDPHVSSKGVDILSKWAGEA